MEWRSLHLVFLIFLSWVSSSACSEAKFEFHEKWQSWKFTHGKSYLSEKEEIEKHIVWLSSKKYIEEHNVNADEFGFKLAMNQFGDMVS